MQLSVVLLVVALTQSASADGHGTGGVKTASEYRLRSLCLSTIRPAYPSKSSQMGVGGVVVIDILVNPRGEVEKYTVLQTPNKDISQSVIAAVHQWKFAKSSNGIRGKVTFYFTQDLTTRTFRVLYPDEFKSDFARRGELSWQNPNK